MIVKSSTTDYCTKQLQTACWRSLAWLVACSQLTLLLLSAGCKPAGQAGAQSPADKPLQKVLYVPAVQEQVTEVVELVGRAAADQSVSIRSRVSGFLREIHFQDGQLVEEGDLLFTIEPDQYQAIYDQSLAQIEVAKTRLDMANKTFARSQKLIASQAISQEEFEENQARVAEAHALTQSAEADAARVKLDLVYTQVKSPISGRVDRALLDKGNYVTGGLSGGTPLTTVVKEQPIKAIANVDESVRLRFLRRQREMAGEDFKETDKLAELKIPCYLRLQDEEGFPHEGILDYAEVQVNVQTGTSQVRGVFENSDGLIKPGMFVRLKIPVSDPHPAVLVPDTAIGTDQATRFVYVINDQHEIEQRSVELGDRRGNQRVILSGVQEGEAVLVAGLQLVQPGMKVDPQLAAQPPAESSDL